MIAIHALQWQAQKLDAAAVEGHAGGASHGGLSSTVSGNVVTYTAAAAIFTAIVFAGNVAGLRRTLGMLTGMRRVVAALVAPTATAMDGRLSLVCDVHTRWTVDQQRRVLARLPSEHARMCVNGGMGRGGARPHASSAGALEVIAGAEPARDHGTLDPVLLPMHRHVPMLDSPMPAPMIAPQATPASSSVTQAVNLLTFTNATFVHHAEESMHGNLRVPGGQSTHAVMQSRLIRLPWAGGGGAAMHACQERPPQCRVCCSCNDVCVSRSTVGALRCKHVAEHMQGTPQAQRRLLEMHALGELTGGIVFQELVGAVPLESRRMALERLAQHAAQLPPDNTRRVQRQLVCLQQAGRPIQTHSNSYHGSTVVSGSRPEVQLMSTCSYASVSHVNFEIEESRSVERRWNLFRSRVVPEEAAMEQPQGPPAPMTPIGPLRDANVIAGHADSGQVGTAHRVSMVVNGATSGERSHKGGSGASVEGCPIWLHHPPSSPPAQGSLWRSEMFELHVPKPQHHDVVDAAEDNDGGADMRSEDGAEVADDD